MEVTTDRMHSDFSRKKGNFSSLISGPRNEKEASFIFFSSKLRKTGVRPVTSTVLREMFLSIVHLSEREDILQTAGSFGAFSLNILEIRKKKHSGALKLIIYNQILSIKFIQ